MRTKKEKKRYLTANQIREDIDKYKAKALRLVQQAEGLELHAKELDKNPLAKETAAWNRSQALKARKAAHRIHESKLKQLKEKLAEWQTDLLPGVLDKLDRSVQA